MSPPAVAYAVFAPGDLQQPIVQPMTYTFAPSPAPTLEEMRQMIREELERLDRKQRRRKKAKP